MKIELVEGPPLRHRTWRYLVLPVLVTACLSAAAAAAATGLSWNFTESLPHGLYRFRRLERPPVRHELVAFPVPPDVHALVQERHYMPEHNARLVKPLEGLPGDSLCTTSGHVLLNGVDRGALLFFDRVGRPLPRFQFCGTIPSGSYFVLNDNPRSFDSRMFGFVPAAALLGTVHPLWTF